jgi:hypothetical protein
LSVLPCLMIWVVRGRTGVRRGVRPARAPWATREERLPLAGLADGLHCIEGTGCTFTQGWAHADAADWSWRDHARRAERRQRRTARLSYRRMRRVLRSLGGGS